MTLGINRNAKGVKTKLFFENISLAIMQLESDY